jgi:hypothetical protein
MNRKIIASVLQVAGFAGVTVGVLMWSIPAGLIVAGGVVILIGFVVGQNQ